MSPTKPTTSTSTLEQFLRPVGAIASATPQRVKRTINITSKSKSPIRSSSTVGRKSKSTGFSILSDATATARPKTIESYFSNDAYGDDKETIPSSSTIVGKSKSKGFSGSIPSDATATNQPTKVPSNTMTIFGDDEDKENVPPNGTELVRSSSSPRRAARPRASPAKVKTSTNTLLTNRWSVSKSSQASTPTLKKSTLARRPLREISAKEILRRALEE
ncbi:hypothetical protein FPQ18DRAFT_7700 [Pyronema domesticum]|nr:hypothetical protein FPQ18DRAFT_7700 [Pyronema domesticum]